MKLSADKPAPAPDMDADKPAPPPYQPSNNEPGFLAAQSLLGKGVKVSAAVVLYVSLVVHCATGAC